ncbi:beta-ketoacyl synthase N-terminal-like domain-containing protein [Amycolatopsis sp. NPDC023774]|uniref:beta-ketoacyl synthase N-terminal-like domain-containing protein n=1 Tax=Amycolatopsis sp. NPDC023774 TaxID=3155015 RepID=UPI003409D945
MAVPQGGAHDRPTQMAVAAADWDLADAGLSRIPGRAGPASLPTVAVVSGTSTGGLTTLEVQAEVLPRAGDRQVSPHLVPVAIPDAGAAALSVRYRLRGRASTITTAYAAGTDAGAVGARLVASCAADVVLAGGSDASLTPTLTAGFTTLRP